MGGGGGPVVQQPVHNADGDVGHRWDRGVLGQGTQHGLLPLREAVRDGVYVIKRRRIQEVLCVVKKDGVHNGGEGPGREGDRPVLVRIVCDTKGPVPVLREVSPPQKNDEGAGRHHREYKSVDLRRPLRHGRCPGARHTTKKTPTCLTHRSGNPNILAYHKPSVLFPVGQFVGQLVDPI